MDENDVLTRFNAEIERYKRQHWKLSDLDSEKRMAVFTHKTRPSRALGGGASQRYPDGIHHRLTLWVDEKNEIQSRKEGLN